MNGYVLDNEQILCLAESSRSQDVHDLIATIRDLQTERDMYKQQMEYWRSSSDQFAEKNTFVLSRLEKISAYANDDVTTPRRLLYAISKIVIDTIAQVKALTVSKQEAEVQAE